MTDTAQQFPHAAPHTRKCTVFLRISGTGYCLEIAAALSALLFGAEQVAGLAEDDGQFGFHRVLDDIAAVKYIGPLLRSG